MTTDTSWDRIEPWKESLPPGLPLLQVIVPKHRRETIGTVVVFEGNVLRAHGGGDAIDNALFRAHIHAQALGKHT